VLCKENKEESEERKIKRKEKTEWKGEANREGG
jgi:hypothetical protein